MFPLARHSRGCTCRDLRAHSRRLTHRMARKRCFGSMLCQSWETPAEPGGTGRRSPKIRVAHPWAVKKAYIAFFCLRFMPLHAP